MGSNVLDPGDFFDRASHGREKHVHNLAHADDFRIPFFSHHTRLEAFPLPKLPNKNYRDFWMGSNVLDPGDFFDRTSHG